MTASIGGRQTEETSQKSVEGDRLVALAAPDHSALEAEFQVLRWPKADFFDMNPGIDGVGVAFQRPHHEIIAERAGDPGKPRHIKRFDAVDAEGVDILGIVGVGHGAAQPRPQPVILFAKGNFMFEQWAET